MSKEYQEFVDSVTSDASSSHHMMTTALDIMQEQGAIPSRLLTTALGLSGESAEFSEVIKKCIFQGKPYDEDTVRKLKDELSDVMWYIAQGCIALDTNIEELIEINTSKLKERYPSGFSEGRSNMRYINE